MLAQTFNQGLYYLDYLMNPSAFEKNCVNKAKKWMHCNGKCQLMKKIIESEKKQERAPEMKMMGKAEVLSSRSFYVSLVYTPIGSGPCKHVVHNAGQPVDQPSSLFHPPGNCFIS